MEDLESIFKKHKKMFEDEGCILLETKYKTTTLKWRIICECGNYHEIKPADFKRGRRCPRCSKKKQRNGRIAKDEDIINFFKEKEEILICINRETDSEGKVLTYVKYKCPKNHIIYKQYAFFKHGHKCKECGIIERALSNTHEENYIIDELKKYGCKYLEGYTSSRTPFSYVCFCGKETVGYLGSIRKGIGCGCKRGSLRGEKHFNYKPYLTELDRKKTRNGTLGYSSWRQDVLKRDRNSCVVCWSIEDNLTVHHLNSFNVYESNRTDINNGVTLCTACHREFHSMYGKESVTKEDFNDFIFCKNNGISF